MFDMFKVKKFLKLLKQSASEEDYDKAIEYADCILEYDEHNLEALYYKSDCLAKLGDLDGALNVANLVVNLNPSCNNLLIKATLMANKKNYDLAFSIFDEILEKCPHFEEAFINKCHFLYMLKKDDEILELSQKFLHDNPNSPSAFDIPAFIYLQQEEYDKALDRVNKALELNQDREIAKGIKKDILERIG